MYVKYAGCERVCWILLAQDTVQCGDPRDHGNEQPDTLKDDKFHDLLSNNQLLKNDFGHNSGFAVI